MSFTVKKKIFFSSLASLASHSLSLIKKLTTENNLGGLSCGPVDENPPANARDMGSIPDLGRFHMAQSNEAHVLQPLGEGNGTPLQYSCLENSTGGGAW